MQQERFQFESGGVPIVGNLYLPAGEALRVVITTGPLTSVKEQAAGVYARALAERGYAALAFDHRTFGESGGAPRQFETPEGKAEDIMEAADALSRDARLSGLPILAVGVCAGGGYMAACRSRRQPLPRLCRHGRGLPQRSTNRRLDGRRI